MHPTIATTLQSLMGQTDAQRPSSTDLVDALIETEKQARKDRPSLTYDRLIGTWHLRFITGTKRSRQKAGMALGAGRFIPPWLVKIQLQYSAASPLPSSGSSATDGQDSTPFPSDIGTVQNSVQLGLITMTLTGPTRFWEKTNSLAFDFVYVSVAIAGKTIYKGEARGGAQRIQDFGQQTLKDQAFFTYFLMEEDGIAARGRGGGLALWTKVTA